MQSADNNWLSGSLPSQGRNESFSYGELFETQLLNKNYVLDNPLKKVPENTDLPRGRFFCTHTVKKRELRQVQTLEAQKVVQLKLDNAIEQKLQQRFGKKYLENLTACELPSSTKETSLLPNLKYKEFSQRIESIGKQIKELKQNILNLKNVIRYLHEPDYFELDKQCNKLKKNEGLIEKVDSVTEYYTTIANKASKWKFSEETEMAESQKEEIKEVLESLKKYLKKSNDFHLYERDLNEYEPLKNIFSSMKLKSCFNSLYRSIEQFQINDKNCKNNLDDTISRGLKELNDLKERLKKISEYKLNLEQEAKEKIPAYAAFLKAARKQLQCIQQYNSLEGSESALKQLGECENKYKNLHNKLKALAKADPCQIEKDIEELDNHFKKLGKLCDGLLENGTPSFKMFYENLEAIEKFAKQLGHLPENAEQQLNDLFEQAFKDLQKYRLILTTIHETREELKIQQDKTSILTLQKNVIAEIKKALSLLIEEKEMTASSIKSHQQVLQSFKDLGELNLLIIKEMIEQFFKELNELEENTSLNSSPKQLNTLNEIITQIEFMFGLVNEEIATDSGEILSDSQKASNWFDKLKKFNNLNKKEICAQKASFAKGAQAQSSFKKLLKAKGSKIDEEIKKLKDKLPGSEKLTKENLETAENQLKSLKDQRTQIISEFLGEIKHPEKGGKELFDTLQKETQAAQELIKDLLSEYQLHSLDRFSNVFSAHRQFIVRLNYLLDTMHPDVADQIRVNLKEFLKAHSRKDFSQLKQEKQLFLYRDLQGKHMDLDQAEKCKQRQISTNLQFQAIFGKKITTLEFEGGSYVQASHVLPFPGLFSWQGDVLAQFLFKSIVLKEPSEEKIESQVILWQKDYFSTCAIKKDIEKLAPTIQEKGVANFEQIQAELNSRAKCLENDLSHNKELTPDQQKFIFEALLFLSRISCLEMSETEHLPNWFNQKMDHVSEKDLGHYEITGNTNYKELLGTALTELIDLSDFSEKIDPALTASQTAYLEKVLILVEVKLKKLIEKSELTVLELLECHALISIFVGIDHLKVKSLGEKTEIIHSLLTDLQKT